MRNDRLHKNENSNNERNSLEIKIRELQDENIQVPPNLRRMYTMEYEQIVSTSHNTAYLRHWIRTINACKRIEYDISKHRPPHTSDIRQHFTHVSTNSEMNNLHQPIRNSHRKRKRRRHQVISENICKYFSPPHKKACTNRFIL